MKTQNEQLKELNDKINEICDEFRNDELVIGAAEEMGLGRFTGWYGAAKAIAEDLLSNE